MLRLRYALTLPDETADLSRHMAYGARIWTDGPGVAALPLEKLAANTAPAHIDLQDMPRHATWFIEWSWLPYNYPAMALAFFTALAALSPTLLAGKLALTLIEAANALLAWKITDSRWTGLLVWASAPSIWWVSREGQFEPLQNLFVLAALLALRRGRTGAAWTLLLLAVQTKVTAVVLVPWFLRELVRDPTRARAAAVGALAGLLPTALASAAYPAVANVFRHAAPLAVSPWGIPALGMSPPPPTWTSLMHVLALAGLAAVVAVLVVGARRATDRWAYVAPAAFLAALLVAGQAQPWYVLLLPAFLVPVADARVRNAAIAATLLMDPSSWARVFGGDTGAREQYHRVLGWFLEGPFEVDTPLWHLWSAH